MRNFTQKQKIILIILIIIICIIYYLYNKITEKNINEFTNFDISNEIASNETSNQTTNETTNNSENKAIVYITGAIKNSGVYELKTENRINDVIEMAGGLTEEADVTNINLAYKIEDGMKIYIPKKGEDIKEKPQEDSKYITKESGLTETQTNNIDTQTNKEENKININTATIEELDTLPGIGEATAQKIIDYRNKKGKFTKIEEIKEVSGIGESKYDKIKDLIYV